MIRKCLLVCGGSMIVKDIIKKTAELLELNDVLEYYDDSELELSDDVSNTIKKILLSINLTNNTIASQYYEIIGYKYVNCNDGVVPFSNISDKEIVEIKNVLDEYEEKVDFRVMADGVHVPSGEWKVVYSYLPNEVVENDEINYYTKIGSLLFAYGVASEYLFLIGDIDNAYYWDKRFKDELFSLSRPKRCINMPSKRWC